MQRWIEASDVDGFNLTRIVVPVSLEAVVQLIAQTTTETGLVVEAEADRNCYPTGIKVSNEELHAVHLRPETFHGEWNYTIQPRR